MMELLHPDKSEVSSLPSFNELPKNEGTVEGMLSNNQLDKHIALEVKTMAHAMAKDK